MYQDSFVPTLETDRLILRGHHLDDFQSCADMWSDPLVTAHISGSPSTKEQSWSRFLRYSGHWQNMGFGYWVVQKKSNNMFIGEVGFADYKRDTTPSIDGIPEAGWVLISSAHGHGYASEAVAVMHKWADSELSSLKTVCIFDPAHSGSIKVAKKIGYANALLGSYMGRETLFMERFRCQA
ncbi:MAG: GNAT family N-acetyltransferase, partial [Granulosicoccaceae bacterium]